jgi:hypothetical protein
MKTKVRLIRDVSISPSLELKAGDIGIVEHYCGNGHAIIVVNFRFYLIPIGTIELIGHFEETFSNGNE